MKRALCHLATLVLLVSIAPPAVAQEQQGVILTLVRQTPWNSPKIPEVDVTFRAENTTSQTLSTLSVVITMLQRVSSVSQYQLSLSGDDGEVRERLRCRVLRPERDVHLGDLGRVPRRLPH